MDVILPAVIVVGSAIAGFAVQQIGPVVVGAVVAYAVLLAISLALLDADLHLDSLGVLFVLALVSLLSAAGAGIGLLLRRRTARPSR